MKQYTFSFSGEITIEAETYDEAYAVAYGLLSGNQYVEDCCIGNSVDSIKLNDVVDNQEE